MARSSEATIPPAQAFRFQGKKVFLTYPQADLEVTALYAHFLSLGEVKYAIIARELHEDGNWHSHACIDFRKRVSTRSARYFDFDGHHANIQTPRNWMASVNYCKKDGNFVEFGDSQDDTSATIFDKARELSYEDYFVWCLEKKIPHAYLAEAWKRVHENLTVQSSEVEGVIRPDLAALKFDDQPRRKSIHIQGPSGIGKSCWAKREAPKPALWVTHMDNLKAFDASHHKSIIFDDMSFLHVPREAQIHLVDNDDTRSIHIRYGVATIPAGTPKIFTSNGPIFSEDPAITRRVIKHLFI